MEIEHPLKSRRIGWILLALSAGIIFFSVAAGMVVPFSASPKPSTVVAVGVVIGLMLASLGLRLVFPQSSPNARLVAKRLAIAFGFVMIIHAFFAFGPRLIIDVVPLQSSELFYISCVWLMPAVIYLIALYGTPILSTHQAGVLRVIRMAVLTGAAFGLSFASSFAFLGFWLVASIIFDFPFRQGV